MSSDQNVKILERLVRNLKRYVDLKLESLRLDAVSRITMLISALVIGVVFFCLASLVAVMLSFAAVVYLAPIVGGYVTASGLVALFYCLWLCCSSSFGVRSSSIPSRAFSSRSCFLRKERWGCATSAGAIPSAIPRL